METSGHDYNKKKKLIVIYKINNIELIIILFKFEVYEENH